MTAQALRLLIATLTRGTADQEVLDNTPRRWCKAIEEMTNGYAQSPEAILEKRFKIETDGIVVVREIDFVSLCEHHLLPFAGTVSIAYMPRTDETGRATVVGLSKLPRLVDCFAHRLQLQERMTTQIGDAIQKHLDTGLRCGPWDSTGA